MTNRNQGFAIEEIEKVKSKINAAGKSYILNPEEDNGDEFCNFFFIGKYEGKEVVYDCALYTLRLHHQSELYEIAEHRAAQKFPQFKQIKYDEDENGDLKLLDDQEEEIGLFMAETMFELEEEESVKVKEHLEIDPNISFGIGLDVALNVDSINDAVITTFIKDYNEDTLNLDPTHYSFQLEEEEE